jgi:lipoate-protein ligase A
MNRWGSLSDIRLLDLGMTSALRSQTSYHAAAEALEDGTPDTIILVSPASPYVCLGYHQDPEQEVDLEYCRARGWPVYRREVGGGAVYLDSDQLFVQWIFHPESLPADLEARFGLFIRPLVETYRRLGIEAEHRPVNDVQVRGRKIGGTGAARIGGAEVLVGSFMMDFDRAAMARVLKVPSEKMRDKVFQGLEDYMTTIRDQAPGVPDRVRIGEIYLEECARALGRGLRPGLWTPAEEERAREIDGRFQSPDWLFQPGVRLQPGIKIHEDVRVFEATFKAPGGLIRMTALFRRERLAGLTISGDFTVHPRTAVRDIEAVLLRAGRPGTGALRAVEDTYRRLEIQSPGLTPAHWVEALALLPHPAGPRAAG